jgi:hypothetical protein
MALKNPLHTVTVSLSLAVLLASHFALPAFAEEKSPENAQALLQEVKKRDLEREIAAKQTEVNRLKEDLAKEQTVSDDLKKSIDGIVKATEEASSNLDRLSAERNRLSQALEVATLRVEAEKLKVVGFKMLSDGQGKMLGYISSRIESTERKAAIAEAELKLIHKPAIVATAAEPVLDPTSPTADTTGVETDAKLKSQIAELKKKGLKTQQVLLDASQLANTAINAASAKLAQADAATAKAQSRADEFGLPAVAAGPPDADEITAPKAKPIK